MSGFHRAGDTTFYDELGVANNASAEEIRDAFRALARLLHPDSQIDAQLKETAERQMRKLNRIYAVLSDAERRRRYDEMLEDEYPAIIVNPHTIGGGPRPLLGRFIWMGALLLSASLLMWVWWDNSASSQPRPRDGSAPSASTRFPAEGSPVRADSAEVAKLRADLRSVAAQRDLAIRELARLRGSIVPSDAGGSAPASDTAPAQPVAANLPTITELPTLPRPPIMATRAPVPATPPVANPRPERPTSGGLAGFWFYVKPPQGQQNKNRALYPPEFIEATITEENGVMQGKYRSRFQIVDRAISPDVNFTFNGPANPSRPLPWTGPGGAKGEVTLRLTAENQLRVEWSASELGSQQGLASGTAVLKRRID